MSFEEEMEKAGSEMGGTSDFYKFREGDNKMRILTEPTIQVSRFGYGICYEGAPYCKADAMEAEYQKKIQEAKAAGKTEDEIKKIKRPMLTKKWMAWAIDRATGKLILVTLPYGVAKTLGEFKASDEAGFSAWPMPYDVNIKAKNAGKVTVEYQFIASQKLYPVTEAELEDLAKKTSVEQILDKMKTKAREKVEGVATTAQSDDSHDVDNVEDNINPEDIPF